MEEEEEIPDETYEVSEECQWRLKLTKVNDREGGGLNSVYGVEQLVFGLNAPGILARPAKPRGFSCLADSYSFPKGTERFNLRYA